MKTVKLGQFTPSVIGMGCMRIASLDVQAADALVHRALECGIHFFDHADIYGGGRSESLFGEVLKKNPGLREQIILQSKCGIRKGFYDMSRAHILEAVDGSLSRLGVETLDVLLFHRPDALCEQEELCEAIRTLKAQGKVKQFGVSNMNPAQIELLEAWSGETLCANQIQMSLMHAGTVKSGINVNVDNDAGVMHDGSVLPFCQRKNITVQAWSPFQYGMFKGCFIGDAQFPELNAKLNELAEAYRVTPAAIAAAWLLRIPGRMQVILGTANPQHMQEACAAADITLTREEWYALYRACGYPLP